MCLYVGMLDRVKMLTEAGVSDPFGAGYGWLKAAQYGFWKPNAGPLQKQHSLLETEASL